MNYIVENMEQELQIWCQYQKELSHQLFSLPKGTIFSRKRNGKTHLYHQFSEDQNGATLRHFHAIKKEDTTLIAALLKQRYIKTLLPILSANIKLMQYFCKNFQKYNLQQLINDFPSDECKLFLEQSLEIHSPTLRPEYNWRLKEVLEWMNLTTDNEQNHPEALKHFTLSGKKVRSKSELLIAHMLEQEGFAYQYEFPLRFEGVTYRPDFMIELPIPNKQIYWEHFGLINDWEYQSNLFKKLELYRLNGIVLWQNLIITFDDADGCLDSRTIAAMINLFILPHFN